MASDGTKLSKKHKNYTDPVELMDKVSADSYRFLLMSSPLTVGDNFVMQDKELVDVSRKLSMIWNMYDFFTMYAEVDGWQYSGVLADPLDKLSNPLDVWVVSRLHQLVAEVEERTEAYDLQGALKPILPFIDDASNWFVRRSRRRFWKSEDDGDKAEAYLALHYVLTRLAFVLAPFTPYLAEELYTKMTGDTESVHLKDWIPAGKVNEQVMNEMDEVRDYVNQGLCLRAKAGLKVRQPLASMTVPRLGEHVDFKCIVQDEVNVKEVKTGSAVEIDENLTPELKREGMMREVVRHVQATRKATGLQVDDRVELVLHTADKELARALEEHKDTIMAETLAKTLMSEPTDDMQVVKVEGADIGVWLKKA